MYSEQTAATVDSNGEIDWNTLGNILTAHMLGEVSKHPQLSYNNSVVHDQASEIWDILLYSVLFMDSTTCTW